MKRYIGTVVPTTDNYVATLNSAVFSDGSFGLHPAGRALPDGALDLFPHQRAEDRPVRAHADHRDKGSYVSYLEGLHGAEAGREPASRRRCRADRARGRRDQVLDGPELVPRRCRGQGRHLQLRDEARRLPRRPLEDQLDAGRNGLRHHLEVPVCILRGDESSGEFYSIAVSNGMQQVDSGTKMIHLGRNTKSKIIAKGIAAGKSDLGLYRGQVSMHRKAKGARNFHQLRQPPDRRPVRRAHDPLYQSNNASAVVEHEATTSKLDGTSVLLPSSAAF